MSEIEGNKESCQEVLNRFGDLLTDEDRALFLSEFRQENKKGADFLRKVLDPKLKKLKNDFNEAFRRSIFTGEIVFPPKIENK